MEIPGYTIIRELGRGGMATVYLARQDRLGRQVALKVMKPVPGLGDDFTARFIKEGRIIAQLQHPQIVTIYDLNSVGDLHYFSMEFLPNGTLADKISAGLSQTAAIDILRRIAQALSIAHDNGIIHRDIKPQNILFRADGTPVLTDFGIARTAGSGVEATALTSIGMIVGSPRYMSPEQSMGRPIDARSDLYSLGCVFYEMLTGEAPYQAEDVISLAMQHCSAPLPKLPRPLARLQPLIDRLLAKAPGDRFENTQALLHALERLEQDQSPTQTRAGGEATIVATRVTQGASAGSSEATQTGPAPVPLPAPASHPTSRARHRGPLVAGLLALLAAAAAVYFGTRVGGPPEPPPEVIPEPAPPVAEQAQPPERPAVPPEDTSSTDRPEVIASDQTEAEIQRQAIASCLRLNPTRATPEVKLNAMTAAFDCVLGIPKIATDLALLSASLDQIRSDLNTWVEEQPPARQAMKAFDLLKRLEAVYVHDPGLRRLRTRLAARAGLLPEMVRIKGGCFLIGAPETEAAKEADETQRQVCVEDFALAKTETRQADFLRFVEATQYLTDAERGAGGADGCMSLDREDADQPWGYRTWANWHEPNKYQQARPEHPVSCVSADDARAYLQWLGGLTGIAYRLPSEAEWEYAARANTQTPTFWGAADATSCAYANVADVGEGWADSFECDDGHEWVAPVATFAPNPWGLQDILGNLAEWTCSEYRELYDGTEAQCAPIDSRAPLVIRGGAWNTGPINLRSTYRDRNYPESRYSFVGFRIAQDAPLAAGDD